MMPPPCASPPPRRRSPAGRVVAVIVSLACLLGAPCGVMASQAAPPLAAVRLPGHVLPALGHATAIPSSPDAAGEILLTVVLRRDDEAGFQRHLRGLYAPGSPSYRRFLGQSEIADRFGPSPGAYDAVRGYLEHKGLELAEGSANRLTLTVRGTRAEVERAFDVRLADYRIGEQRFHANDVDPALPSGIAASVLAVGGLSNLADVGHGPASAATENLRTCATSTKISGNQLACGIGYVLAALLYNLGCLSHLTLDCTLLPFVPPTALTTFAPSASPAALVRQLGPAASPLATLTGAGQKVGIVAFDSFRMSDVSDFFALAGVPASRIDQLSEVEINGGAPLGPDQSEVLLDIQTVMLLAPDATVAVYSAPFAGAGVSFQTMFNRMIDDGVTIISNSWAYCEDQTSLADVQSIDAILQSAAASGISVFTASGDTGSWCLDGSPNTVAVPAGAPHITAVGGTSVTIGPGGTYVSETWWDGAAAVPPTGQGGFGVSAFFARPAYQDGFTAAANRSVPDVAVNADPSANGVPICQADKGGCPSNLLYCGTSIGAPIWAAFTALLNESLGESVGFLNPLIYPLGDSDAFHSPASMGSDFAHGLGSPNMSLLALGLHGLEAGTPNAGESRVFAVQSEVPADGSSQGHVVVQLRDAEGSTVGGKVVVLAAEPAGSGAGHSLIQAPSPSVTDASGQIQFIATNRVNETVTYTAVDVTDGDLAVPGSAQVTFSGGSTSCVNPTPPSGENGYVVMPFATGFVAENFFLGNVNWGGCPGASHPAFVGSDVLIANFRTGALDRFGVDGGAVSSANVVATHNPTFGWPVVGKDGRLYAAFGAGPGGFTTGSVVELDPATGAILRTLAANQRCPAGLAVDPVTGDLFFAHSCFGAGSDDPSIHRIRDPESASPAVEVYATLPATPNGMLAFAPNGTLYAAIAYTNPTPSVVRVAGTDTPSPPAMTTLTGVPVIFHLAVGEVGPDGEARSLIGATTQGLELFDITTVPPARTVIAQNLAAGVIGPDAASTPASRTPSTS